MNKKIFLALVSLLLLCSNLFGQRLLKATLNYNGKIQHISYLNRRGIDFVSAKELSLALGGNFYYNDVAKKLEMKFPNYKLKVTAVTQYFIIIEKKTNQQKIYQIPISTLGMKNDVLLPITYSLPYISEVFGSKLIYNSKEKNFTITNIKSNRDNGPSINSKDLIKEVKPNPPKTDSKYDIFEFSVDEKTNGTLIKLKSKKKLNKFRSSIVNGNLLLFISGASVDKNILKNFKPKGLVRTAEIKNVSGNFQFSFKLKDGYSLSESFQDPVSYDLMITIHNKSLEHAKTKIEDINKWTFDVIVIDAGHGGKDPGAIGVRGVKEKNVNLGIALKLGKLIESKMKDVKVVYTRKNDKFVELYKRGKIANEADGKLFISIHCNSLRKKPSRTRGHEVYLLRPGRTKEAIAIAEFENNVIQYEENPKIYEKLTDENFILVSMAHSSYMRYSEKFASELDTQLKSNITIPSRGIKQAGFFVLVGASMPSVLIETGFLSNRTDENYLNSKNGQQKIANSIYSSIVNYRKYYEKIIETETN